MSFTAEASYPLCTMQLEHLGLPDAPLELSSRGGLKPGSPASAGFALDGVDQADGGSAVRRKWRQSTCLASLVMTIHVCRVSRLSHLLRAKRASLELVEGVGVAVLAGYGHVAAIVESLL